MSITSTLKLSTSMFEIVAVSASTTIVLFAELIVLFSNVWASSVPTISPVTPWVSLSEIWKIRSELLADDAPPT